MKNIKSLEEFIKEQSIKDIKEKFERLASYKYGDMPKETNNETGLYIVLDEDDEINVTIRKIKEYITEHETYQPFPPTKCVYRLDKPNNAPGQQKHIHVYADKKHNHQLYAINIDGTPHDGSKYQLNNKHQEALKALGFPVPKDGLLEWLKGLNWETGKMLFD